VQRGDAGHGHPVGRVILMGARSQVPGGPCSPPSRSGTLSAQQLGSLRGRERAALTQRNTGLEKSEALPCTAGRELRPGKNSQVITQAGAKLGGELSIPSKQP